MDKQTTAAFILIGVILVVWLYMNSPEPQPPGQNIPDTSRVDESVPAVKELEQEIKKPVSTPSSIPQSGPFASGDKEEKIITIENDLVKLELTSKGARIRKYYLKEYKTWYYRNIKDTSDFYNTHVQLVNPFDGGDLNLVFVSGDGQLVNTSSIDFSPAFEDYYFKVESSDSIVLSYSYKINDSSELKKNFIIYGDQYSSKLEVEMVNMNNVISGMRYDLEWSNGINFVEENSQDESNFANGSAYSGG
jgi:YidC/Oxa1 family membrane protein insertase